MASQLFDAETSAARPLIRRAKRIALWWAYQRRRAASESRRARDTSPIFMAASWFEVDASRDPIASLPAFRPHSSWEEVMDNKIGWNGRGQLTRWLRWPMQEDPTAVVIDPRRIGYRPGDTPSP